MNKFSYNISLPLEKSIKEIETLRESILLLILPPKFELEFLWKLMIDRVFCSLNLAGNSLSKIEMENLLINHPKKIVAEQKDTIQYKKALDYISLEWTVSSQNITAKIITNLHNLYQPGKYHSSEVVLNEFINYLKISPEHPIVQAAVVQAQLVSLAPFTNANGITGRLLAYLLLYKHGYNFRNMLVIEKNWQKEPEVFRDILQKSVKNGNITSFLEYFAQSIVNQLTETLNFIKTSPWQKEVSNLNNKISDLNDRQKSILIYLNQPDISVTNRKAQTLFGISQITASRDLTKLSRLGLVFSHGKGRSVYYTKV